MRLTTQPMSSGAWNIFVDALAPQLRSRQAMELLNLRLIRNAATEPRRCGVELEAQVRSRSGPAAAESLYREVNNLTQALGFVLRVDGESARTATGQMIYRYRNPSVGESNPGTGDDGGLAGVREPRCPKPSPGSMAASSDIPRE